MSESDNKSVVIATTEWQQGLSIIAKDAMVFDSLEIHYTEKYAPTVEYLLRILRKAFGWLESDRGNKNVENTKCYFNQRGICTHKEKSQQQNGRLRCNEPVRCGCKVYKRKFVDKIPVNYVVIEKVGQIRNL